MSRTLRLRSLLSATALFGLLPAQALAQRASENALRSAEDAFGTSIGAESIGLYSPSDVRGFSPQAAGNIRLEGIYLDSVNGFNSRLVQGSSVRVGISAQGYPFPAPTGIGDFRLRLPGDEASLSVVGSGESYYGDTTYRGEIDLQLPIIPGRLGLAAGINASRDAALWARSSLHAAAAAILRWRPTDDVEIIPFWSGLIHRSEATQPRYFTAGDYLPPRVQRGDYVAQPWMAFNGEDYNHGLIARMTRGRVAVSAGLFRSIFQSRQAYSDLYLDTSREGLAARHLVSAIPGQRRASTSGEVRAAWNAAEGPRRHIVYLNLRARDQKRRYGGSDAFDLGAADISAPGIAPEPGFAFGPQSRDSIRQITGGLGYEGRWAGIGELTLGVQRTDYRKTSAVPGRNEPPSTASPWLINAAAALHLSDRFALYGGFTRGLEESPVAPDSAVNRDEAPPALLTRQFDGGIRWSAAPGVRLVAGLFNIEKPYFSLDQARFYRRLGEVRHRGAEISVTGNVTPDLSLVAGAVLLDAEVLGEAVDAGLTGGRPVGSTRRTIIFSAEYRPPALPGLALDLGLNNYGSRVANTANTLSVPAWTMVNAGLRYQWRLAGRPTTLRLQVANLFNAYVWEIRASNAFFYNAPRHLAFRLTTDL